MTPEQQKEEISRVYLQAVAAKCGFAVGSWSQDHGCVDTTVGASGRLGAGTIHHPKVDIQLKASSRTDREQEEHFVWDLERDHFDKLCAPSHVPHLLVLLMLPEDLDDCIEHTANHILVRKCAYWLNMSGIQPTESKTQRVKIPKKQVFSPEALMDILTRVSEERFS